MRAPRQWPNSAKGKIALSNLFLLLSTRHFFAVNAERCSLGGGSLAYLELSLLNLGC